MRLGCRYNYSNDQTDAAQQGLAAANRQLGVPEPGSILVSGLCGIGADGQRCLLQLNPDPLGGEKARRMSFSDLGSLESLSLAWAVLPWFMGQHGAGSHTGVISRMKGFNIRLR